jgi:uncharacterized protein (UPF0218 family)
VVVELQPALRSELKEPMGPVFTDATELLAAAGRPVVAVGDMVTYHLLGAGHTPAVALVDERTEREAVDERVTDALAAATFDREVRVENPPATLTAALLEALAEAVEGEGTTLLDVDGEEDLATLPAILAAPDGAGVVYGQPGEGMVLVTVDSEARTGAREILEQMDGDPGRLFEILGAD